jgi:hypothetical protein
MFNVYARTCRFEDVCLAENHLRQFVENDRLRQDLKLCSSVLAGYGRCGDPAAGQNAEALLEWMKSIHPTGCCVLQLCSSSIGKPKCRRRHAICRLGMPVSPSPVSYQILVEICRNCNDYLMELFEDCMERRMLDDRLIKAFREYGPDLVVEQL